MGKHATINALFEQSVAAKSCYFERNVGNLVASDTGIGLFKITGKLVPWP